MRLVLRSAWAPAAVLIASFAAARTPYGSSLYQLLHFLGGAAAVFFFSGTLLVTRCLGELQPAARLLLSFSMACTVVVLWEIGEFAWDQMAGTQLQEGVGDTMEDLIYGVCGAAVCLVVIAWLARHRRTAPPP